MSRQQMSSADAAWLHMDRATNLMVVNSVMWFGEPLEFERAREAVRLRLVEQFPRFRQRVIEPLAGMGTPSWLDDPRFDLDRHLHHLALPSPGDAGVLQKVVGDLISTPLDRAKPLWDIYVFDGYGAGTALVARMHHSIADGIALARVLLSMTDARPELSIAPAVQDRRPPSELDPILRAARTAARLSRAAILELRTVLADPEPELQALASRTAAGVAALGKLVLTRPDHRSVLRGKLGPAQRVAWIDDLSLEDIRAIGRATGATVNDVLVTATTGALRRYLIARDSPLEDLRAMVPFNLRPAEEPLPRELGNQFGLIYLDLPVGTRDLRERLNAVHRRMESIKHSPEAGLAYGILELLGQTPAAVEQRVVDMFSAKCTLILTNVPGPRQPVYFAGTRVSGVISWVPAGGSIGLGVSIFSYDGRVTVGLRADASLVPDPGTIVEEFRHELDDLSRLRPRGAPGTRPHARA